MKNLLLLLALVLPAAQPWSLAHGSTGALVSTGSQSSQAQDPFDHSHGALTAVYGEVLKDGLVDYTALRKSPKALDAYLRALSATTPAQHAAWTRDQRFAFWINAYNGFTIQLVRDKGPVKSIKKIGSLFTSPWEKKFIPMPAFDPEKDGDKISLDEIEHELIRPIFKDARVHAAINCASMGCPPLRPTAFTAEGLDAQLKDQVSKWLQDEARNRPAPVKGKIRVSKIFDWFESDFGENDAEVALWIADHVGDEEVAKALRSAPKDIDVKYLDYDWSLNAQPGKQ